MNHVIIVAGGVGTRMNMSTPKQYYKVNGVPIIMYSVRAFANHPSIDSVVIVVADQWLDYMKGLISSESLRPRIVFARAGKSRQHSVYNGLLALNEYAQDSDIVLIHDSVRPLFPSYNIDDGIAACKYFDGAIPVIPVKDATYQSYDGTVLSKILPRQELYSGQSPEAFVFGSFFRIHSQFSDDDISKTRGCSEIAFKAGLSVKLITGSERNFKITTIEDLRAFELEVLPHSTENLE